MEQRLSRLEETYERGFSRLEETYERGFSRLEEMIAELCERRGLLMRRIDGDEEQYPVMDDETDLLGTRMIVDPNLENPEDWEQIVILEEESTPQSKVPIANSEILKSIKPGKVDLGLEKLEYVVLNENLEQEWDQKNVNKKIDVVGDVERDQKVMSNTKVCSAHQLFDVIPRRTKVLPKEHKTRFHKSWRFKFKDKAQPRELIKGKMGVHEANASQGQQAEFEKLVMMNERLQTSLVIEQVMRDKKIKFTEQWMFKFKMDSKPARTNHLLHQEKTPRPELAGRKMNHGVFIRLHSKQQGKCSKCWMFKFRKKEIDQQLGCDLMVTCLDNQTTWTSRFDEEHQGILQLRTENSLSRRSANAHGMITREKDGTVKPNLRHSLLAVQRIWEKEAHEVDITDTNSVLQKEFEQVVNYTPSSVIKLEGLLLLGDESFQIKHKWRFKLLPLILECELYSDRLMFVTNYAQQFDISGLMILMTVGTLFTHLRSQLLFKALKWLQITWFSSLPNLEVKVSSKEGDLLQENGYGLGLVHGPCEEKMGCVSSDPRRLRIKEEQCCFSFDHRKSIVETVFLVCS